MSPNAWSEDMYNELRKRLFPQYQGFFDETFKNLLPKDAGSPVRALLCGPPRILLINTLVTCFFENQARHYQTWSVLQCIRDVRRYLKRADPSDDRGEQTTLEKVESEAQLVSTLFRNFLGVARPLQIQPTDLKLVKMIFAVTYTVMLDQGDDDNMMIPPIAAVATLAHTFTLFGQPTGSLLKGAEAKDVTLEKLCEMVSADADPAVDPKEVAKTVSDVLKKTIYPLVKGNLTPPIMDPSQPLAGERQPYLSPDFESLYPTIMATMDVKSKEKDIKYVNVSTMLESALSLKRDVLRALEGSGVEPVDIEITKEDESRKRKVTVVEDEGGDKQTRVMTEEEARANVGRELSVALQQSDFGKAMEIAVNETLRGTDARIDLGVRAVTPPIWADKPELTEWTMSLLSVPEVRPSNLLRKYLQESTSDQNLKPWINRMFPVINGSMFRLLNASGGRSTTTSVMVHTQPVTGIVKIDGELSPDKQLCRAIIALYYHSLEAILYVESTRLQVTQHPDIVLNPVFHRALLACCCWCVTKAIGVTQKLRATPALQAVHINSILEVTESNPYEFMKVSDSFVRSLTSSTAKGKLDSPLILRLPKALERDMRLVESILSDTLLWVRDDSSHKGSLPNVIHGFKRTERDVTLWPPESLKATLREEASDRDAKIALTLKPYPTGQDSDYAEYRCVNHMVRKMLKSSLLRLRALCKSLKLSERANVPEHAWIAFRYLIRNYVELLYHRHLDQWLLCCLYAVGKAIGASSLSFRSIINSYIMVRGRELGDVTCHRIVSHIRLDDKGLSFGNVITLYNSIFIVKMKDYLLTSVGLKVAKEEYEKTLPKPIVLA